MIQINILSIYFDIISCILVIGVGIIVRFNVANKNSFDEVVVFVHVSFVGLHISYLNKSNH